MPSLFQCGETQLLQSLLVLSPFRPETMVTALLCIFSRTALSLSDPNCGKIPGSRRIGCLVPTPGRVGAGYLPKLSMGMRGGGKKRDKKTAKGETNTVQIF